MKENISILIFEKDENLCSILHEFTEMAGFRSGAFTSHEAAYKEFCYDPYSICLIALEKSPEKEFALARKIKAANDDTILIFTCEHPSIEVITAAYDTGADDVIRKPYILEEIYLRALAIIKRTKTLKVQNDQVYKVGKYVFNTHKQILSIGDSCTKLTTKECELLHYLCEHVNTVVDRNDVLRRVWYNNSFYNARSMDVYMTRLRRLLKDDESISIINIHGKGFKLRVNHNYSEMYAHAL